LDALAIKDALGTLWAYQQPAAVNRFFTRWQKLAVRRRVYPL